MNGLLEARTLSELVAQLERLGSRELFRHRADSRTSSWSYEQVGRSARAVADLLRGQGLAPGDRVMLWGPNSPEWAVAFLGTLLGGVVPVPIDLRFRPDFLREVQRQTEARLLLGTRSRPDPGLDIPSLPLEGLGERLRQASPDRFAPPPIGEEDLAQILYTSGSTGDPKGVMLTHRNLLSELVAFQPVVPPVPAYRFLSVLPLSHIFEQMGGLLLPIVRGGTVVYLGAVRPTSLARALREESPLAMMVVPRLLELLRDRILMGVRRSPGGPYLFRLLLSLAPGVPFRLRRELFWPVHRELGGNLRYLVSGGAPLDPDLERFWDRIGVVVLQGYGLTETASAVTCNRVEARRVGSVGRPLANQETRIAQGDEILVRGPNVTPGYYRDPDLTAEAFEDGWLRTGDVGFFDGDGYLYLRGRKKEVIITSEGMNVYPEDVEAALARASGIREGVAVEWHGKVHAVLLLEEGADPRLAVREANRHLDAAQKIRDYTVWPRPDLPRTATLKVRRAAVLEYLRERGASGRAA